MNPFAVLNAQPDLAPWLDLLARLDLPGASPRVAPASALAVMDRKAREALARRLWAEAPEGAYFNLRIYDSLDLAPLVQVEYLGLSERQAHESPADPALRGAWRRLLEAWGDVNQRPANKNQLNDDDALRLLLLGRAQGFPANRERQLAEFLGLLAAQAPEDAWFALELQSPEAGAHWIGRFRSRDAHTGLTSPEAEAVPWSFFDSYRIPPTLAKQELPEGLTARLGELMGELELRWLRPCGLDFLAGPSGLWLLGLDGCLTSPKARLEMLLDLHREGRLDPRQVAGALAPSEVEGLLVGRLVGPDPQKAFELGTALAGNAGAASGKAYFSAQALLAAPPGPKILVVEEVYPEDLGALRAAEAVVTTQGGYASHGPVMARSLGLPALMLPEAGFEGAALRLDRHLIAEGREISLEIPPEGVPALYDGPCPCAAPESEILRRLGEVLGKLPKLMGLLVNAERPQEVGRALAWGAEGVGLLRLENILGEEPQLTRLRALVLGAGEARTELLRVMGEGLKAELLKLLDRVPEGGFCLRLLDIPSHELWPRPGDETTRAAQKLAGLLPGSQAEDWVLAIEARREVNPMLGHRGARLALTHFDLYRMMVLAFLEAGEMMHRKHHRLPRLQVMMPFVGAAAEWTALLHGRHEIAGLVPLFDQWSQERGFVQPPFEVDWGVMIELPAAALDAAELARHASFFSFGGNDLAQTALGFSRDDWSRFGPLYGPLDLMPDPFLRLGPSLLGFVELAAERGRRMRPDLGLRYCGDQRLLEEDLLALAERGVTQVSVAPGRVPATLLRLVRLGLLREP